MDTAKTITHLGLCAGYGGIELGLKRVIPTLRSVALCEIESFAVANLVSKMEAGLMDPAPIWTDLKTFPWESFRDRVDILTGGYPCQPFSAAGKRLGTDDPRHLWPFIANGIRLLRPKLCFFENVEGHISLGLREVIGELESMGYKVSWGIFSAAECGAPHQRKRVFILANSSSQRSPSGISGQESRYERAAREFDDGGHQAGWPSRPGEQQYGWEPPRVVNSASARQQAQRSEPNGEWGQGSTSESGQLADSHRIDRSAQAEGREHDRQVGSASEGVGDSEGGMPRQSSARDWREGAGGASEGVGDTQGQRPAALRPEHERLSGELCSASASGEGAMGDSSEQGRKGSGRQDDSRGSLLRSSESDGSCTDRSMESEQWQTKSALGLHSNESSSFLGQALTLNPYGDSVIAYENISNKINAREVLFNVWKDAISQEIQWTTRGLQCLLAEKVLQSGMQLDSFTQRICYFIWCIQTGYEAQGWGLHGMWVYETCGNSSQGQKPIEQLQRELGYAMCQLSYEIALARGQGSVEEKSIVQGMREASERAWVLSEALPEMEEVWRSTLDQTVWEKGCYIEATSIGNRTDELRLLGNGVVPATAALAFRTLMNELCSPPSY